MRLTFASEAMEAGHPAAAVSALRPLLNHPHDEDAAAEARTLFDSARAQLAAPAPAAPQP
jgi:hypothetical protein